MPVEIKELVIRAVATADRPGVQPVEALRMGEQEKEALIEACVRQVLKILKKTKDR